jgi:hypothetical protein
MDAPLPRYRARVFMNLAPGTGLALDLQLMIAHQGRGKGGPLRRVQT